MLQKPEVDTLNKGERTVIFGKIRNKLEEHLEEEMIDQLVKKGKCVIPNVGTVRYDSESHTFSIEFTHEFTSRVETRAYKSKN